MATLKSSSKGKLKKVKLAPSPVVEELCAPLHIALKDSKTLITALKGVATNLLAADLDALELEVAKDYVAGILRDQKTVHSPTKLVRTAFRMVTPKKEAAGAALVGPEPEPWGSPVDGAKLLSDMRDAFATHLLLAPHAAEHLALDCLRTHCMDAFEHNPFNIVTSAVLGCGKTLLLQIKQALVCRPLLLSHASGAGVTRMIDKDHPSLLLDEGDAYEVTSKFRAILDSAHTRSGATTSILTPKPDGGWEPRIFSTWAPITVALIGTLHPTIMSRGITT